MRVCPSVLGVIRIFTEIKSMTRVVGSENKKGYQFFHRTGS